MTDSRSTPPVLARVVVATIVVLQAAPSGETRAADLQETVGAARRFLACSGEEERVALSGKLAEYEGDWRDVVEALRPRPVEAVEPGYYREEHFTDPQLREKHPEDLLYLVVPSSYRIDRPTGLVVFMHGGGKGSPRTAPGHYMTPADSGARPPGTRLGEMFETLGMIGVGPSAPWNENDHSRWCLPEADDYIADVVRECKTRFHIDADRVFLLGHSMGGFGAYHQVQRQPDRFAAVIASAGSWSLAQWPVIRGTTLLIVHGTKDAELGVRDRHTDIAFARFANDLLSERGIPHVYKEHPDGHSFGYGKPYVVDFLKAGGDLRRDPFFAHVVLASPVGYSGGKCFPVRHNRWITLDAADDGPLEYDALEREGPGHGKDSSPEEWQQWKLKRKIVERNGAMIEAVNLGENGLKVATTNVSRFTLWLHQAMVDFGKPIEVTVNGEPRFEGRVAPSLVTVLESYERRRDWGLVYPAKITLGVDAEEGVPGKQMAAGVEVPANMNIWKRRDRSKKETAEEKARRRLMWFEDKVDRDTKEELHYWLYLPVNYGEKEKCPLILFLHGAGERGGDLEKVKVHGPPKLVDERSDCPAIVVSPQCPNERIWSPTQLSLLLDKCMETLKVDPDRVYVTGLSMGGFGTWALCTKEPERFAAAIPICGGGDAGKAARLVKLPIWVFHGAKDTVVTPDYSQKMVDAIRAAGGTRVELTIYPEANHDSWTETYANDEVARWLLSQKRGE